MWGNTVTIHIVLKKNYEAKFSTSLIWKNKIDKDNSKKKHKKIKKEEDNFGKKTKKKKKTKGKNTCGES